MIYSHSISSKFSISSQRLDAVYLSNYFSWRVSELAVPSGDIDFHVTFFDLALGRSDRLDLHLGEATNELMKYHQGLEALSNDCRYALWVTYRFPNGEGAGNIAPVISSRLAHLRVEVVFQFAEY